MFGKLPPDSAGVNYGRSYNKGGKMKRECGHHCHQMAGGGMLERTLYLGGEDIGSQAQHAPE